MTTRRRPPRLNFQQLEPREVPTVSVVANVAPAPAIENQSASSIINTTLDGFTYFVGFEAATGHELWRSDGTAAGTKIVKDLTPGKGSTDIRKIVVAGGNVVFAADPAGGVVGPELFKTDGTDAGTGILLDNSFTSTSDPTVKISTVAGLAALGGDVVYGGFAPGTNGGFFQTAYRTPVNNPSAGTVFLESAATASLDEATDFVALTNSTVFTATSKAGRGLYSGSGSLSAQFLLGTDVFRPFQHLVRVNGNLAATLRPTDASNTDYELFVTDGQPSGTQEITVPSGTKLLGGLVAAGGKAYFTAKATDGLDELWVTEGTQASTVLIARVNPETNDAPLRLLRTDGDRLFFPASNGVKGIELWTSDGTVLGTKMITDLAPDAASSVDMYLQTANAVIPQANGIAYFLANAGGTAAPDFRLYRTDGTAAGTVLVESGQTLANLAVTSPFYLGSVGASILFRTGESTPRLASANATSTAPATTFTILTQPLATLTATGVSAVARAMVSTADGLPAEGTIQFLREDGDSFNVPLVNGVAETTYALDVPLILRGALPTLKARYVPNSSAFVESSSRTELVALPQGIVQVRIPVLPATPPGLPVQLQAVVSSPFLASGTPLTGLVEFFIKPFPTGSETSLGTVTAGTGAANLEFAAPAQRGGYQLRAVYRIPNVFNSDAAAADLVVSDGTALPTTLEIAGGPQINSNGTFQILATAKVQNFDSSGLVPLGSVSFVTSRGDRFVGTLRDTFSASSVATSITEVEIPISLNDLLTKSLPTIVSATYFPNSANFEPSSAQNYRVEVPEQFLVGMGGGFVTPASDIAAGAKATVRYTITPHVPFSVLPAPVVLKLSLRKSGQPEQAFDQITMFTPSPFNNGTLDAIKEITLPGNLSGGNYELRAALTTGAFILAENIGTFTIAGSGNEEPNQSLLGSEFFATLSNLKATVSQSTNGVFTIVSEILLQIGAGFNKNAEIATATNAAGQPVVAVGTGPGTPSLVQLFNGLTGQMTGEYAPFEVTFLGGVYVAKGDLDGDGEPETIISPNEGGGPRVVVLDGKTNAVRFDFFGIDDPAFRGGARCATGDVNGDGVADLIVGAGFQGGPRVAVYDGRSVIAGSPVQLFGDFFAFEESLRNGCFVAAGDVNGDGFADIIAGGGPGGGPRVIAISGRDLVQASGSPVPLLVNFFAGDDRSRTGVRVAVKNQDGDGLTDIITAVVGSSTARAYLGKDLGPTVAEPPFQVLPGDFTDGLNFG